jgi:regulator of nonsense transcripts 1
MEDSRLPSRGVTFWSRGTLASIPGDLQKFKVVERPELAHLVDCIVFSAQGKRPAADMMSGGDLDGDTCRLQFSPMAPPESG